MTNHAFNDLLRGYSGTFVEGNCTTSGDQFRSRVQAWAGHLQAHHAQGRALGLLLDNSVEWLAVDMACASLNIPLVPLPSFFTDTQLRHAIGEACVATLITDNCQRGMQLGFNEGVPFSGSGLSVLAVHQAASKVPDEIQKITFTSGTTGDPKGVCLTAQQQLNVARALALATSTLGIQTHLCLLPFSVLLENIAGVYAPMMAGANVVCLPMAETGLKGAASFDAQQCLNTIARYQAESIILLPQMLMALLQASTPGDVRWKSLKFIAVGGGKVPMALLTLAKWFNLPVYEGYGLSECASVVCLNTPLHNRPGTVGRPLDGVEIKVDAEQHIWVRGRAGSPYLHELQQPRAIGGEAANWLPTGDLGALDAEGYLTIFGRKKNLIITGFGRNISPEWPESVLLSTGVFLQAAVFGEGRQSLVALLVPRQPLTPVQVADAVNQVNSQLPDYAQIGRYLLADEPFSHNNGFCTVNGRLRRDAIWQAYHTQFDGENQ